LTYGDISLHEAWTVEVGALSWEDGPDWAADAEGVRATVDPMSLLFGATGISKAEVDRLDVRLGNPDEPFDRPESALRRLRDLFDWGIAGGHAGGPAASRGTRALPRVVISGITGAVYMEGPWGVEVVKGRITAGTPHDTYDASVGAVEADFEIELSDRKTHHLEIEGRFGPRKRLESVVATVEPPLVFTTRSGSAGIGGISFEPGELTVLAPTWMLRGRFSLEAESAAFRWEDPGDDEQDPADDAMGMTALPAPLRSLIGRRRIKDVDLVRPVLDLELPRPIKPAGPMAETPRGDVRSLEKADGAFRLGIVRAARGMRDGLQGALTRMSALAARIPMGRMSIHGASVRYRRDGVPLQDAGHSLANLNASLSRTPDGAVTGRVTFECPEAKTGSNEARLVLDPDGVKGSLSLRMGFLPLFPYEAFMPRWFTVGPETILGECDLDVIFDGGKEAVGMKGSLSVDGSVLYIPGLASEPLSDLMLAVSGIFEMDAKNGTLSLEQGMLTVGLIRIPIECKVSSMHDYPKVWIDAGVERLKAQDLIESIPTEMIPSLAGVMVGGSFAASLSLDVDTRDMSGLKFDFSPDVADLKVMDSGRGANLELLRHEFFHRIEESGGRVVKRFVGPSSPSWISLDDVPRHLVDALTTSEDSQFFRHHGFSLGGIRRSLRVNLERGGFYQGASTLSQQLVKNLFLSSEKTLARKLQEAFITWQLERFMSKDRILELYLNVVEWGPDSHGLREAAMHYFAKVPSELNLLETAYLVSIIPNPRLYHEHYDNGMVPHSFLRRVKRLLAGMVGRGLLASEDFESVRYAKIRFALSDAPTNVDGDALEDVPDEEFSWD